MHNYSDVQNSPCTIEVILHTTQSSVCGSLGNAALKGASKLGTFLLLCCQLLPRSVPPLLMEFPAPLPHSTPFEQGCGPFLPHLQRILLLPPHYLLLGCSEPVSTPRPINVFQAESEDARQVVIPLLHTLMYVLTKVSWG